ncbi:MAG: hypothetical protein ACUVRD_08410 [Bacteroidia bacterium]
MIQGMVFPQPSSFIRRKFLDQVGLLNEKLHYGMDYDLFARIALVGDFCRVPKIFSRYRLHKDSKSVKSSMHFTEDWTYTFLNILHNTQRDNILTILTDLGIYSPQTFEFEKYNFPIIYGNYNEHLALFYFLSRVMQLDYTHGNFSRLRKIHDYISSHFTDEIREIPELYTIYMRYKFIPDFMILALRKLKRILL